jgi:hypothetical protein
VATTHRIILLNAAHRAAAHNFLKNHPKLDPRGSGDRTFGIKVALLGDPDDGSIVRGYLVGWRLPDDWWTALQDFFVDDRGWNVNLPTAAGDVWHYTSSIWTLEAMLADTTRKPFALKVVPVEVP